MKLNTTQVKPKLDATLNVPTKTVTIKLISYGKESAIILPFDMAAKLCDWLTHYKPTLITKAEYDDN